MKKFRISNKKLIVKYYNCNIQKDSILNQFLNKFDKWNIKDYFIIKNKTETTLYIECFNKIETRKQNFLDLICPKKNIIFKADEYHGVKDKTKFMSENFRYRDLTNIKNIKFSDGLELYLTKKINSNNDLWKTAYSLAKDGQIDEACSIIEKYQPDYYYNNHMKIEKSLRDWRIKSLGFKSDYSFENFIIPNDLKEALQNLPEEKKTLFLCGESGTGKTKLLESYFMYKKMNPLILNNIDRIKDFKIGTHDCILFDDVSFKNESRERIIKLFDSSSETTFRVLYGNIVIPKNTSRYVCSNKPLEEVIKPLKLEKAISRRVKSINIGDIKLYKM